jgi:hypothetical protein
VIDLCLQSYGTTDLLVKFCKDNNISSLNYVPPVPQLFVYDETLVTDQKVSNYVFVTGNLVTMGGGDDYVPEDGEGYYESEDGGSIYITE